MPSESSAPKPASKARQTAAKQQQSAADERKAGRPTRLTPDLEKEILQKVELGVPMRTAAMAAGVPGGTFESWQRQGREGRQPFARFLMGLTRARARAEISLHVRALGGGPGSAAAMWTLERRFPDDYGQRSKLELSGDPARPVAGDIRDALKAMPVEELRARLDKLSGKK